jgi:peptide/nickel transport system permease protein
MIMFFVRRLLTSSLVVLVSTLFMYVMVDLAIDPLEDLRLSTSPNKQQLIDARVALLNLDDPLLVRYFDWLGGVANCFTGDCQLGTNWQTGQSVESLLAGAVVTTLQLITFSTIVAILLGIMVGIVSALRQYTGFDYSITFVSFLLYALPTFWVAVLLKQFGAIEFNTFLADPDIPTWFYVGATLLVGVTVMAALGGSLATRAKVFGAAALGTLAILFYMDQTKWLADPGLGIGVVAFFAIGWAFVITILSTGLKDRRSLYAALTVAGIGIALYYPMLYAWYYLDESWPMILGLGALAILVGVIVGYFWGGPDRWRNARTAGLTAIPVSMLLFMHELMSNWDNYMNSGLIKGRPIATFGSRTPNFQGSFWMETLDLFTHLVLPTLTLILISFAAYTRYSRGSMLEVLNQDYIRTARAKGLTERTVVMRHAFRNALIPLASIVPVDIITLVGGAVITETIFSWFGMGRLFVDSLDGNIIDPVMAYLLIVAVLAVVANFVADLIYAVLDPRIRVNA